ncbi:acyltransferase domain-containing protein [Nocardia puris]|uniref:type I polyketide synthase n=1 Tax=Nocardia puris TaxID=208602 RepID=UPI0018944190|nr:type I polyketide synthase [Nocardia puris]MBF6214403.1 acyltransferase domain-containing protein [Nocardia puris]MBF6369018.1 acyltransferase domain-containing protein [Nocardia puris]MBF6462834.1 acyltransferase domain-containing protein [Nocardia puris]
MTTSTTAQRALLEQALRALEDLRGARSERIAVLGAGVRLPPAIDRIEAVAEFVDAGGDAIGQVRRRAHVREPAPRADGEPSGLLLDVDGFDADFFGLSGEEVRSLDPQHRLLLETTWDALADAGIPPARLRGSRTGVYVGTYAADWLLLRAAEPDGIDAYTGPGTSHAMAANRLSYLLDVDGPSLAVDTACSSSLTALHLAVRALRGGDCETAIVAGVHVLLSPHSDTITSRTLPLSPTGRCRSFDAAADGIVRGEGCVVLVLRGQRALDGGITPRGWVLGTAVNHGGRANGLTAPNPKRQEAVLRRALSDAGVEPDTVGYIEAHGTGTRLGDPIEMAALAAVYGVGTAPCAVGSVKAALGHLEATAGLAGVAHALGVLRRGRAPGLPHLRHLNPEIEIDGTRLRVCADPVPLADGARHAAVSSFGFGGANAHVVLAGPASTAVPATDRVDEPLVLPVAASSAAGVERLRRALAGALTTDPLLDARELARGVAARDLGLPYRAAWIGDDRDALLADLGAPVSAPASPGQPPAIFVFSGHGAEWPGMGRELTGSDRLRDLFDELEREVADVFGWSLRAALCSDRPDAYADTQRAQVGNFAMHLAIASLLDQWGLEPRAVVGHSMGEVSAAVAARVLDLRSALTVLAERAALLNRVAAGGAMVAARLSLAAALDLIAERTDVTVAAENAPESVVFSGAAPRIAAMCAELEDRGIRHRRLPVAYAFHGPRLAADATEFADRLDSRVRPRPAAVALYSSVTGARFDDPMDARHWAANVCERVRFRDAVTAALPTHTSSVVVEIGAHPVLTPALVEIASGAGRRAAVVAAMSRGHGGGPLAALPAALHRAGCDLDWQAVLGRPTRRVGFPLIPWHHTATESGRFGAGEDAAPRPRVASRERILEALCRELTVAVPAIAGETHPSGVALRERAVESLQLVQVRNRMEQALGIPIPLSVLLSGDSPEQMATALAGDETSSRIEEMSIEELEQALSALDAAEEVTGDQ